MPDSIELHQCRIIITVEVKQFEKIAPKPESTEDFEILRELFKEQYGKQTTVDFTYTTIPSYGKEKKTNNPS